jgi:hypothetical protein
MSPIKMLLGPPWTATGEPGAFVNHDSCDAFEGVLPEGQDVKNEIQDAASNKLNSANRLIVAGILITENNATLLSVSYLRRFGVTVSSGKKSI